MGSLRILAASRILYFKSFGKIKIRIAASHPTSPTKKVFFCHHPHHSSSPTKKLFFCQSNHLHHSSSPTMPLRLLFPFACPLPPLLRLLPKPAGARFYSPSRLSTSLVTPTSRRPINRHGLLPEHIFPTRPATQSP